MKLSERPLSEQVLILRERYRAARQENADLRQQLHAVSRQLEAPPIPTVDLNRGMAELFREEPLTPGQEPEWVTPGAFLPYAKATELEDQ